MGVTLNGTGLGCRNNSCVRGLTRWRSSECSYCIVHTPSQFCCVPCHTDCNWSQVVLICMTMSVLQSLLETALSLRPRLTTARSCAAILSQYIQYSLLENYKRCIITKKVSNTRYQNNTKIEGCKVFKVLS